VHPQWFVKFSSYKRNTWRRKQHSNNVLKYIHYISPICRSPVRTTVCGSVLSDCVGVCFSVFHCLTFPFIVGVIFPFCQTSALWFGPYDSPFFYSILNGPSPVPFSLCILPSVYSISQSSAQFVIKSLFSSGAPAPIWVQCPGVHGLWIRQRLILKAVLYLISNMNLSPRVLCFSISQV
jgi:hypothetical protein